MSNVVNCNYTGLVDSWDEDSDQNPLHMNFAPQYSHGNQQLATAWDSQGLYVLRVTDRVPTPVSNILFDNRTIPLPVEVLHMSWFWCAKTYSNISFALGNESTQFDLSVEPLYEQGFTGTIIDGLQFQDAGNKTSYVISSEADEGIKTYLRDIFDGQTLWTYEITAPDRGAIDQPYILFNYDLDVLRANVAEELTNRIRSSDNLNATVIHGDAFVEEPYFEVRWPWIVLPLVETCIGAGLLICTIYLTRGEPLLKSSVITFLLWPLLDYDEEESRMPQEPTVEKLQKQASGMTSQIGYDDKGTAGFVRIGS
ncbi:hypothetical protein KJ359_011709 [Pestalotiopsis sp. 9143b]|nr:hypothetical protein KJ359_011709 [Pestalotiopsis sp. 9143b]